MKKQANGLYRTKVVIGHEPTGKPVVKWVSAKTKKELEQKKQEIVDRYVNGNRLLENMTFGVYAKQWYEVKKKPFIAKGTQNMYECILNKRLFPAFRDRQLRTITSIDIQSYINTLTDLSEARVASIRNVMTAVFGSALADGLISVNPASKIRVEARPQKERYILTPADRDRIEIVCSENKDGLLLAMLYYTGIRDGELCAMRWSDIDFDNDLIYVRGSLKHDDGTYIGSTKTESSERTLPIPAALKDILTYFREDPDHFLIHVQKDPKKPIMAYELRIRWSRLMEACKLGAPEKVTRNIHWRPSITPHALRHNYTTMLYENGIDPYTASKLLGHSSVNTTMNIYTHFSDQAIKQARENLDNIFKVAQK